MLLHATVDVRCDIMHASSHSGYLSSGCWSRHGYSCSHLLPPAASRPRVSPACARMFRTFVCAQCLSLCTIIIVHNIYRTQCPRCGTYWRPLMVGGVLSAFWLMVGGVYFLASTTTELHSWCMLSGWWCPTYLSCNYCVCLWNLPQALGEHECSTIAVARVLRVPLISSYLSY